MSLLLLNICKLSYFVGYRCLDLVWPLKKTWTSYNYCISIPILVKLELTIFMKDSSQLLTEWDNSKNKRRKSLQHTPYLAPILAYTSGTGCEVSNNVPPTSSRSAPYGCGFSKSPPPVRDWTPCSKFVQKPFFGSTVKIIVGGNLYDHSMSLSSFAFTMKKIFFQAPKFTR